MKVSKKTINKTLIWGGSILIIMVIFYILNRFLNKESFQNPSRIRTACTNGKFELNGKCVDGSNDYCYKKNSAIKDNKNSEYQKYYWNPTDKKCIKYVDKLCQSTNGKTNGKKYKVNTTNGICEEVKMTDEEYCKNNKEKKFKFDSKLNECIGYTDEYCKSLNPVSFLGKNKLCIIGNNDNCKKDSSGLNFWNGIDKKCINNSNIYCNTLNPVSFLDKNKLCIIGNDVNCKKYYKDRGYSDFNDVYWNEYNKSCIKISDNPLCPDDYVLHNVSGNYNKKMERVCLKKGIKTNFKEVIENCMNEDILKNTGNEETDQNNARFQVENCIRNKLNIHLNKETMFDPNVKVHPSDFDSGEIKNTNNFSSVYRYVKKDSPDNKSIDTLIADILKDTPDNDNVNNYYIRLNEIEGEEEKQQDEIEAKKKRKEAYKFYLSKLSSSIINT